MVEVAVHQPLRAPTQLVVKFSSETYECAPTALSPGEPPIDVGIDGPKVIPHATPETPGEAHCERCRLVVIQRGEVSSRNEALFEQRSSLATDDPHGDVTPPAFKGVSLVERFVVALRGHLQHEVVARRRDKRRSGDLERCAEGEAPLASQ